MVTTTFVKDMKVDLQGQAASASLASTQSIRILIDPAGRIFVDNLPVRVWVSRAGSGSPAGIPRGTRARGDGPAGIRRTTD